MSYSLRGWLVALTFAALLGPHAARGQEKIVVPDVFSYHMPAGFAKVELPGSSYPTAVETTGQGSKVQAQAMITVNADPARGDLGNWCAQSLARNKAQLATLGAQMGELEPFATAAGVNGYRATVDLTARGRAIHYVMYFFDGGSGTKIAVTCACPAPDAPHYAPLFEAAMKTFSPK